MLERHSRRLAGLAQLVASALVLGLVFWSLDTRALGARFSAIRGGWVILALGLVGTQCLSMAARWWFIARRLGVGLSFRRAALEYTLSALLNQVLPGGIAGDALRGLRHHRRTENERRVELGGMRVVLALVLDRLSGQLGLWLVVLAGAIGWWGVVRFTPGGLLLSAALPLALGALVLAVFWVARRRLWLGPLRKVWEDGGREVFRGSALWTHTAISIGLVFSHVLLFACAGRAIGVALDPMVSLCITPLLLLASSLPAFFAGWGVREAAAAALFHMSGLDATDGASVSLLYGAVSLLGSLPGLWAVRGEKS